MLKADKCYLFYDTLMRYKSHNLLILLYIARFLIIETDRYSSMRKIIILPCNYARIICNPLPSSSAYCFPTRSIEIAFDWVSRRDRIKISGPLSQIRCSPLLTIYNILVEIANTRSREYIRDNFLTEERSLFPLKNYFYDWTIIVDMIRKVQSKVHDIIDLVYKILFATKINL